MITVIIPPIVQFKAVSSFFSASAVACACAASGALVLPLSKPFSAPLNASVIALTCGLNYRLQPQS